MIVPLEDLLNNYTNDMLNHLKTALKIPSKRQSLKKGELVALLKPRFEDSSILKKDLANLSPVEELAVTFLQQSDYRAPTAELAHKLLTAGLIVKENDPPSLFYSKTPTFKNLLANLLYKGLIFTYDHIMLNSKISWTPGSLAQLNPTIIPLLPPRSITPPFTHSGSSRTLIKNLGQYSRYVQSNDAIRLTTTGAIYKKDFKKIVDLLSLPAETGSGKNEIDNPAYLFLRHQLIDLDILLEIGFDAGLIVSNPSTPFWHAPPLSQIKTLFQTWLMNEQSQEIKWLESYQSGLGSYTAQFLTHLVEAKTKILPQLKKLGTGWKSLSSLVTELAITDPNFLWPIPRFYRFRNMKSNQYAAGAEDSDLRFTDPTSTNSWSTPSSKEDWWKYVEQRYIEKIVMGPLFWLGLVDLGFDTEIYPLDLYTLTVTPTYYQLTEMGAWLLELGPPPTISEESGGIVVQPNFEILAIEPISQQTLFTLEQFANSQGVGDRVTTFTFDRQSIYRGQQRGWTISKIVDFLEKETARPLPNNIKRSLEEWEELHHRITIYHNHPILEVATEQIGNQLNNTNTLSQLTPTLFISSNYTQLKKELSLLNFLPVLSPQTEQPKPPRNSILITSEGEVQYQHQVPSIYIHQLISPITIEENGILTIFPPKLKTYLEETNLGLNELIKQLETVHNGPLHPELLTNLKAWSHHYGTIKYQSLIIFEFETVELRNELCSEPSLTKLLRPFKKKLPLATGKPTDLDKIEEQLDKFAVIRKKGIKFS